MLVIGSTAIKKLFPYFYDGYGKEVKPQEKTITVYE